MSLKDILKRRLAEKERFKELETEEKLQNKLAERKKSSNERELERFIEETRQKKIDNKLGEFRKQRQKESMKTTILNGKNIFKGQDNILKCKKIFSLSKTSKEDNLFF